MPEASHVFARVSRALPTAVSVEGAWITDTDVKRYLDAAGGAIVVGVGHGDRTLIEAAAKQLEGTRVVTKLQADLLQDRLGIGLDDRQRLLGEQVGRRHLARDIGHRHRRALLPSETPGVAPATLGRGGSVLIGRVHVVLPSSGHQMP